MKQLLLAFFVTILSLSSVIAESEVAAFPNPTDPEISIFPNPTTNFFSLKNGSDVEMVIVYNVFGSKVKTFQGSEHSRYNVMDLPNGLYLVQFVDDSQGIIATRRLSKE